MEFGDIDPNEKLPYNEYQTKISNSSQEVGEFILNVQCNVLHKAYNMFYALYSPSYESDNVNDQTVNDINILY